MGCNIATIINYCTNDYKFIHSCINEAIIFSKQVIVPVCDHFIDGTSEKAELLQKTYEENAENVQFLEYKYNPIIFDNLKNCATHGFSRLIGFNKMDEDIDYVLFLDADEIVEGQRFSKFLENPIFTDFNAILFANYYYFRDVKFRAKNFESSVLMVKKSSIFTKTMFLLPNDRVGIYNSVSEKKIRSVTAFDGAPMVHHYSWVRTKEEMLKKVETFGHSADRDWVALIEKEFSRPFNGKCFVHGYEYETVKPYITTV